MDGSQDIFTDNTFVQHDGILIVISFPRHVSHQQVLTQSQLTVLGRVSLGQDIAFLHTLTLVANRTQVNRHILVRTTELGNAVFLQGRFETYKLFILRPVIKDTDGRGIHELDNTVSLGCNLRTGILTQLLLDTGTHNRSLGTEQRYRLAHHVRAHQCTVRIIMLQEGNQRSCDRGNLLGRHIHQFYLSRFNHRIICILTSLDLAADERTVVIQRRVALSNNLVLLFFSSQVDNMFVIQVHLAVTDFTVRRFDEAQIVNLSINTQRRNQTDVRSFRCFNRTQTTVVGIVHVTHLESCTVTRQTAGTQRRQTTFVGNLGQRVCLVHEL